MASEGFIKLYRKILKWGWYKQSETLHIFVHLLLTAQYEDCCFMGVEIKRGQALTSIRQLSSETGISIQSVRTSINRLKSTHELTQQTSSKYSLFTILNYEDYQSTNTQTNNQLTHDQHTTNTHPDIKKSRNKEDKNKTPARNKFGQYGWVRLSLEEYNRLLTDLGESELLRCIEYVDRSAQKTTNKNSWKDWNLVIRDCSRKKWGMDGEAQTVRRSERVLNG